MEFKAEGPDLCRADHSGLGSEKTMSAPPKEEWSQIELLTEVCILMPQSWGPRTVLGFGPGSLHRCLAIDLPSGEHRASL